MLFSDLDFSWQIGENEAWPEVHVLNDVVSLSCNAEENVKPLPNISMWVGYHGLPHRQLVKSER